MISLVHSDITQLDVDAIVNAANPSLLGGGGVDGAIHRRAGPELLAACRALNGCATGEAKLTPGFGLPANYVIHTVGPVWQDGKHGEPRLLERCYRRVFGLALQHGIRTIAFPGISTGVYGFPKPQAASIALMVMLENEADFETIIACCFSRADLSLYQATLTALQSQA